MDPLREMGKALLVLGVVLAVAGALLIFGTRLPFHLGHLPGDIVYQRRNVSIYFPIVTCLGLSAAVTAIFWIVSFFRR